LDPVAFWAQGGRKRRGLVPGAKAPKKILGPRGKRIFFKNPRGFGGPPHIFTPGWSSGGFPQKISGLSPPPKKTPFWGEFAPILGRPENLECRVKSPFLGRTGGLFTILGAREKGVPRVFAPERETLSICLHPQLICGAPRVLNQGEPFALKAQR